MVVGGAASGIGRATAQLFAAREWFVGCLDRDADALRSLEDELGSAKGLFRPVDVTDRASLAQAIEAFGQATGGTWPAWYEVLRERHRQYCSPRVRDRRHA